MSKSESRPKLGLNFKNKELLLEVGKDFLGWIVVTAVSFIYSMVFLLVLSLVLMSVWSVTFKQIVMYSVVIMAVCSVLYAVKMVRERLHA